MSTLCLVYKQWYVCATLQFPQFELYSLPKHMSQAGRLFNTLEGKIIKICICIITLHTQKERNKIVQQWCDRLAFNFRLFPPCGSGTNWSCKYSSWNIQVEKILKYMLFDYCVVIRKMSFTCNSNSFSHHSYFCICC